MTRRIPIWRRCSIFFGRNIRSDIEDEIKFHVEGANGISLDYVAKKVS